MRKKTLAEEIAELVNPVPVQGTRLTKLFSMPRINYMFCDTTEHERLC